MKPLKCLVATFLILTLAIQGPRPTRADLFGGDVAILSQILIQAIDQVYKLSQLIGKAKETVSILEDMNRGVKEVLRIAETAHIPIPPGVYEKAKQIDAAASMAREIYGEMARKSPTFVRNNFRSGVEALHLSEDAFDYSTFLDKTGERIKSSAVLANQASATRLTAETLGVLLHSVNHSSRIQAKSLELSSNERLETSARENARFESFVNTHQRIEDDLKNASFSSLNGLEP